MIRQNSEYDQELPQSQTEYTPIANSYTYEVYGLSQDTFVWKYNELRAYYLKNMCVSGFPNMPNFSSQTLNF